MGETRLTWVDQHHGIQSLVCVEYGRVEPRRLLGLWAHKHELRWTGVVRCAHLFVVQEDTGLDGYVAPLDTRAEVHALGRGLGERDAEVKSGAEVWNQIGDDVHLVNTLHLTTPSVRTQLDRQKQQAKKNEPKDRARRPPSTSSRRGACRRASSSPLHVIRTKARSRGGTATHPSRSRPST